MTLPMVAILEDSTISQIKTTLKIAPTAVVCNEAVLHGDITIGEGTVVHPRAIIVARSGPIVIGSNNIFEEQTPMYIGSNNIFEVGQDVEAMSIGSNNALEARSRIEAKTTIGDGCVVGATQRIPQGQTIANSTIVWALEQTIQPHAKESHLALHTKQLEILWKTLPNSHHLRR
ncbi:dynactin subunit 6-like [Planoprotostelium fungivorum]|uniref:Dynactin subunit 6 n=1 Tax=Planoprotostelium fungivorum TaxID=1890364 RepID=A0A2P6N024_9EUKA|nr:dynactin subunit 6-like [Planoprotostelium fungivorum]